MDRNHFKEFTPAWWCRGRHVQTIWRTQFGMTPTLPIQRKRWETPDDDFLDLDFLEPSDSMPNPEKQPTVLFLHGLEGSSRSKYIVGMLRCVQKMNWRGVALNFRSCSGEMNRQPRFYHSGETRDIDWVIGKLKLQYPSSPLFAVGFSLGGNALLKWLGEQCNQEDNIRAAVAISVPFDLKIAAHKIDHGFGKIYGQTFLKTLKKKALIKERRYPGLVDRNAVRRITSYVEFDNQVTAPIHGFKNHYDYWSRCSARNFISGIRCQTLIIHAKDDPFLPGQYLPIEKLSQSKWITTDLPKTGGHVGFVEGIVPWKTSYWTEYRTMQFLSKQESAKNDVL